MNYYKSNLLKRYLACQIYFLIKIKVFITFGFMFLCISSFGFQNKDTIRDVLFISEGEVIAGLEKNEYAILNKKGTIYLLPSTTFVCKDLCANFYTIANVDKFLSTYRSTIIQKKNIQFNKEKHRSKINSVQIRAIPLNRKHSSFYLSAYLNYGILPSLSNQYDISITIKPLLLVDTNEVFILKYKTIKFDYQQFIKAFGLKILLTNRPPPFV